LELEVQANGQAGSLEVGNANLQFSVKKPSGTILNMLNSRNVTPIVQLNGVKKKWFINSVSPLELFDLFPWLQLRKIKLGAMHCVH